MTFSFDFSKKKGISIEIPAVWNIIHFDTREGEWAMREELLEYIFAHSNEEYLSDLRMTTVFCKHRDFILNIKEESYTLHDWNQLLEYIYQPEKNAGSIAEAKEMLLEWSSQNDDKVGM